MAHRSSSPVAGLFWDAMNYRHQFHAGNFADVMKHALLVRLIQARQQKDRGFLYLDTHAGRGGYDLARAETGDTNPRRPEWPDGIGRLWHEAAPSPELAGYLGLVREYDRQRGNLGGSLRFYPGSPWIAGRLARAQDRLVFCERHPAECAALRLAVGSGPRITIQESDGYAALKAFLPPPERRALVLIDPPFENQDEYAKIAMALGEALRRAPTGVFAIWYPLTERARADDFLGSLVALRPPPTLVAELAISGTAEGLKMNGCGLVVINPPWRFDRAAGAVLGELAGRLAQARGGGVRVDWLVGEDAVG